MILSKVCNKEIYDRTKSYKIEVCKIVAMVAK